MELNEWIAGITDDTAQDIAARAGLSKRTVQHQINNGRMSLENIVRIAAAYNRHPLRALIEWEVIDPAWASVPDIHAALRLATEDQLGDEVLYRMKLNPGATVGEETVDDLAARRQNPPVSTPDDHDGTVTDWDDSQPFAADSSPDEGGSPDDYIP